MAPTRSKLLPTRPIVLSVRLSRSRKRQYDNAHSTTAKPDAAAPTHIASDTASIPRPAIVAAAHEANTTPAGENTVSTGTTCSSRSLEMVTLGSVVQPPCWIRLEGLMLACQMSSVAPA